MTQTISNAHDSSHSGLSFVAGKNYQMNADTISQKKEVLFTKDFILLLAGSMLFTTGVGVLFLFPLMILDIGGGQSDIGFLMGVMSLSAVLARPWISGIVDRVGRKNSILISCLTTAVICIVHLFFIDAIENVYPVLILLRLLIGAGGALGFVACLTMAADLASGPRLNEGLGFYGIMPMLGMAIGPAIGESIIDRWGFSAMFLLGAFFFFAGFLLILIVEEKILFICGRRCTDKLSAHLSHPHRLANGVHLHVFRIGFRCSWQFRGALCQGKRPVHIRLFCFLFRGGSVDPVGRQPVGRQVRREKHYYIRPFDCRAGFASLTQVNSTLSLMTVGFIAGMGHGLLFPSLIALTIRPVAANERGRCPVFLRAALTVVCLWGP